MKIRLRLCVSNGFFYTIMELKKLIEMANPTIRDK